MQCALVGFVSRGKPAACMQISSRVAAPFATNCMFSEAYCPVSIFALSHNVKFASIFTPLVLRMMSFLMRSNFARSVLFFDPDKASFALCSPVGRTHTIVRLQTRIRRKDGTESFGGFVFVLDLV